MCSMVGGSTGGDDRRSKPTLTPIGYDCRVVALRKIWFGVIDRRCIFHISFVHVVDKLSHGNNREILYDTNFRRRIRTRYCLGPPLPALFVHLHRNRVGC